MSRGDSLRIIVIAEGAVVTAVKCVVHVDRRTSHGDNCRCILIVV